MINPQLATYGTTLAQAPVKPLSAQSLVQQPGVSGGIPQIPTGEVTTQYGPTKERKIPGADTLAATGAMDTAQQAKLNAMDEQARRDVAVEQAQAQAAEQRAKEAAEIEKKREEMRAAEERRRAEETAARAQALAEYEKAAKTSTLWQDMTPARKFISAIATGLGQWSSVMGGGPNGAYQIYRDAEENHRHVQETNIRKATEKVMQQTKSAEEAKKYFDTAMDNLDKQQLAKLKVIDLQLAAVEKANPEAAARAAQARAQVQIDYEKGKRDFVSGYDTTVRQQGTSTQTSSGDKGGSSARAPASNDVQNFSMMQANARLAERMLELQKGGNVPSPEQYRQYMTNKNLMISRAEKEMKEGTFEVWKSKLGRGVNALPDSVYPKGMTKEQKEYIDIEQALSHQRGVKLFGQSAMASAEGRMEYMNPVTASPGDAPEDIVRKGALLAEEFIEAGRAAAEVSKTGEKERAFEARHGVSRPVKLAPAKLSFTQRETDALKWAKNNPGPKAEAIKAKIRRDKGIK